MQNSTLLPRNNIKDFETPLVVSRIAYAHCFDFVDKYYTQPNSANFCELLFVERGNLTIKSDSYIGELSANQLIIHKPCELHSFNCRDNPSTKIIIIGFECTSLHLLPFAKKPVTLNASLKLMLSKVLREFSNVYIPSNDKPNKIVFRRRSNYPFGSDQMIKLRLELFLIELCRNREFHQSSIHNMHINLILEVQRYITEHYRKKISLDELCFIFGTNKTTLCRYFKKETGMTVLEYINTLKINEAKTLLCAKISVTKIAEELGFSSIHYFCKLFHTYTGTSPSEYSKKSQEANSK